MHLQNANEAAHALYCDTLMDGVQDLQKWLHVPSRKCMGLLLPMPQGKVADAEDKMQNSLHRADIEEH
jgi:hypothetical protein